ncbi:MAG: hypothetical protein KTR18_10330 [Acidiferrobacterales bacterium]|nr:hypothetical protein [Acidiferrobacterales bacterium]
MEYMWEKQQRADKLARPMFFLSLTFLVLLGTLIVIELDIPRVTELSNYAPSFDQFSDADLAQGNSIPAIDLDSQQDIHNEVISIADSVGNWVLIALLLSWPLFWVEYALTVWPAGGGKGYLPGGIGRFIVCLIPPLRLAAPSPNRGYRIWLPGHGWKRPGRQISRRLEREFSKPMLIIALLILPILVLEYGFRGLVEQHNWLQILLHSSTGLIWIAFTAEFIIMVNATDKKLLYIRKNWIDLAIILLPLISFLRSLRVLRIAKLAKMQKLAKLARIYRMRGLLMKVVRALMVFEVIHRIIGLSPEKRLERLKIEYGEKLEDLEELQEEIKDLETSLKHKIDKI